MRILIAEDDNVSRKILKANLEKWGYDVVVTTNGDDALKELSADSAPNLAILDWMMPGMDGVEVCRHIRERKPHGFLYLIMLTAKGEKDDIVRGLESGADDYVIKPFDKAELHARVKVGERMVKLELSLEEKITELNEAIANVHQLQGIIPICAWCKKIRDDGQYWHALEEYLSENSEAQFSHSICPDCREKQFGEFFNENEKELENSSEESSADAKPESRSD
ncbi:MAG: response regulator [candidate division Zixibacteria bacterium]|nr:response regulator [candidate division Zixibacteria bacterium]